MLFRALDKPLPLDRDPFQGWNGLIGGGLEIREIPGGHLTIMHEPYVLRLAAELQPCLERAVASPPNTAT